MRQRRRTADCRVTPLANPTYLLHELVETLDAQRFIDL